MGNSVDCINVRLLNDVERNACGNNRFYRPYDAVLAAAFLFPEKCIQCQCTYKMVQLNCARATYTWPNGVSIIEATITILLRRETKEKSRQFHNRPAEAISVEKNLIII